ncbi:NUDIX domain-containing protein [Candidatus Roizmanbacteria bacterium]|nr:NUDIX domain-containing protein [Candidatus Roizmanbacteria bacterium]
MKKNNNIIQTTALIYLKNKKVLLTLCKGKQAFYMPGGKPDNGENHLQALVREINEELAVDILPKTIKKYGVFEAQAYGKPESTILSITCYYADIRGEPVPTSEVEEIRFFSCAEYLKMETTALATCLILKDLKKKGLLR